MEMEIYEKLGISPAVLNYSEWIFEHLKPPYQKIDEVAE